MAGHRHTLHCNNRSIVHNTGCSSQGQGNRFSFQRWRLNRKAPRMCGLFEAVPERQQCWFAEFVTPISSSSADIMVFLVFPDTNLSEKLSKRITQTCWAAELSARSTWRAANVSGAKED